MDSYILKIESGGVEVVNIETTDIEEIKIAVMGFEYELDARMDDMTDE